jgi:hypothetical protein
MKIEKEVIKKEVVKTFYIAEDGTKFTKEDFCLLYEKYGKNVGKILKDYLTFNTEDENAWNTRGTLCIVNKKFPHEVVSYLRFLLGSPLSFGGFVNGIPGQMYAYSWDGFEPVNKHQVIYNLSRYQKQLEEIENFERKINE